MEDNLTKNDKATSPKMEESIQISAWGGFVTPHSQIYYCMPGLWEYLAQQALWERIPTRLVGIFHNKLSGNAGFVKKLQGFSLQEGKSRGFCFQNRRSCGNESCLFLHPLPKKLKSF